MPKRWWEAKKTGWWRAIRNIPVFWAHQRTTHMDRSELIFHIILNIFITLILYLLFFVTGFYSKQWARILVALAGARTLSYLFNDHFWGGLQVSFTFIMNCGTERIREYLIGAAKRLSKCSSISGCAVYGSIVRGEFHKKSDLDICYIRRPGFFNAIAALSFAVRERVTALFTRIPLDLYVGDTERFLDKIRDDENPMIIKDSDGSIAKRCPKHISLDEFLKVPKHN